MRRTVFGPFCRAPALLLGALLACSQPSAVRAGTPPLKVSENHRFLVKEDGAPFFYLGDTAWELFHRLNREEADRYLDVMQRKEIEKQRRTGDAADRDDA